MSRGKDLIGLDQHQVRTWTAFHHHVVVCMFAHAFAANRKALLQTPTPRPDDTTTEGARRGKRPGPEPDPPATTNDDLWRQLTTVADILTLLGAWLQPA